MSVIEYQLLVQNWVQAHNPTDGEIFAVIGFLEYLQDIEDKGEKNV